MEEIVVKANRILTASTSWEQSVNGPGSPAASGTVPGAEDTASRAGGEQNPRQSPWCRCLGRDTLVHPFGKLSWIPAPLFTISPSLTLQAPLA